ncbi:hypothetical protein AB0M39_11780 [Streptomyces sp. NPDC051907]|uniref:hypothetical protein n=1 Tax=Streptomyces sp. NPDC051907 TaxID=3155284 RepID=UPI003434341C
MLGAAVGLVTNVITSDWNWWLFASLVLLVSLCVAGAASLPTPVDAQDPAVEPASAVSTLPPVSAVFTGRRRELESFLSHPERPDHRSAVFLITGEPGVGKTELAVQAAHRLTHRFPDRSSTIWTTTASLLRMPRRKDWATQPQLECEHAWSAPGKSWSATTLRRPLRSVA